MHDDDLVAVETTSSAGLVRLRQRRFRYDVFAIWAYRLCTLVEWIPINIYQLSSCVCAGTMQLSIGARLSIRPDVAYSVDWASACLRLYTCTSLVPVCTLEPVTGLAVCTCTS